MKWLGFGATNLSHATKITGSELAKKSDNTQLFYIMCYMAFLIMGMFSEIHASSEASGLAKVLLNAIKANNKDIMIFCKENVLPLYESACVEAWGTPNKDDDKVITDSFNAI